MRQTLHDRPPTIRVFTMNDQARHNLYEELINRYQGALYGYIYAVIRNWEDADDLYQSVCLVLWRKFESFRPGTDFFAWARQTAKIEISNFLRCKRSPGRTAEQFVDVLTEIAAEPHNAAADVYLDALQQCKEKLSETDNELLRLRYAEELSTVQIAASLQRQQPNVSRSLSRIRRWLFECVESELIRQGHVSTKLP